MAFLSISAWRDNRPSPASVSRWKTFRKVFGYTALGGGVVATAVAAHEDTRERVLRSSSAFLAGALVVADYQYSLKGLERGSEEYFLVQSGCHQRAADRMLRLCERNKGMYVKFGQQVSTLPIPRQFTSTLSVLQDNAPTTSWEGVVERFKEDFEGKRPHQVFATFETTPIAAASLAQVHRAVTHDGKEVAVKVQYPGLEDQFESDLWAWKLMAGWLNTWYEVDLRWIVKEVAENILQELDFVNEANNGELMSRFLEDEPNVKVPAIDWRYTTSHILTMEFVHGVKVNDVESLSAAGVDPRTIGKLVTKVFSDMIFCRGFVHCDPHPGNLMVEIGPGSNATLVVLDHGLYRRMDESFRTAYAQLWEALVTLDTTSIRDACGKLGLKDFSDEVSWMLTYRPANGKSKATREDAERFKEKHKNSTASDWFGFFETLPRDMLFVLKTQSLFRSINKDLGGTSQDRFNIMATEAVKGRHLFRKGELEYGFLDSLRYAVASFQLSVTLWIAWMANFVTHSFDDDESSKTETKQHVNFG